MDRIEEKYGIKKSNAIGLFVCMILIILQAYSFISQLLNVTSIKFATLPIVQLVLLIGFAYYALVGYKKPHGNVFKYLMLFYALFSGFIAIYSGQLYSIYANVVCLIKLLAIAYVAGRLDRINQNKIILGIIIVVDLVFDIYNLYTFIGLELMNFALAIDCFSSATFTLTLTLAYTTRFKLHKEAGMLDK